MILHEKYTCNITLSKKCYLLHCFFFNKAQDLLFVTLFYGSCCLPQFCRKKTKNASINVLIEALFPKVSNQPAYIGKNCKLKYGTSSKGQ